MKEKEINILLNKLKKDYFLFAPQKMGDDLPQGQQNGVAEVDDLEDIVWDDKTPYISWKRLFLPSSEGLFDFTKKEGIKESQKKYPPIACIGMSVIDLRALILYEMVFANDSYYQKRRRNMIVVGYDSGQPDKYKKRRVFEINYKEEILEHLIFDIFIARQKNGDIKIYSGSEKGQKTLEDNDIKKYQHVEFAGPIPEQGQNTHMLDIMKKLEKSHGKKIWDELAKRCIACGKCAMICPTCFCFNLKDDASPNNQCRSRHWGVCFYNDFSKVAGGHKELDTVRKKIFFWYYHKFVRIPKEYGIPGCVSCGRCSRSCPVDIYINETIKAL